MREDIFFLKKAFKLAKKGEGFTSPNPLVGAIITKNKKVLACGYHKKAGCPHAEIDALQKITSSVEGATLYVNLEPCYCWGKTPPCVDRIIESGIKKVVVSTFDPNPDVCGKSVKKLREAGIEVVSGALEGEAKRINEIFFKNMLARLPFVAVKSAMSLDGRITTATGESKWITGEPARKHAKRIRNKYDAALVGVNTVLKDNPRLEGIQKKNFKIIIDPRLRMPEDSFLLRHAEGKVIIISSPEARKPSRKLAALEKHCEVCFVKEKKGVIDLKEVCKLLYKRNIMSVFAEGGSYTLGQFFDQKCVDKIYFFFAKKILGGTKALPSIGGEGIQKINNAVIVTNSTIKKIGDDFLVEGYPSFKG